MSIKVFFNPRQNVGDNDSFSPSAGKPAKVAAQYLANFDVEIREDFKPLTKALIALAHDTTYVHEVLTLKRTNGFGNKKRSVAESLPWTTGSMAAATMYAYKNKTAACSLTSGFHHAEHSSGGGFCTFEGQVIAAQILRLKYGIKEVGIIDMDSHGGNGVKNIKKVLKLDYINHLSLGYISVNQGNASEWLDGLEQSLLKQFSKSKFIIYQAGADCWFKDPLVCGGQFTKEQMRMRDEIVFAVAKKLGIGIVYNLAGGYSQPFGHVLDIHNNTMIQCQKVFNDKDYSEMTWVDDEETKCKEVEERI